ncbi:MAG: TlpA family protein disulfide reductase [Gammaproteobacteria bacterium]|nr:TlpA family protein disulfide reductase [Gammaproteobacteria bacterium]MDH5778661.1 TlpA family protein disulfide reductase [Gammaproteobacteria bacterium]
MKIRSVFLTLLLCSLPLYSLQAALFKDFNDKPASITQYAGKGKWLVVMIWASDCHVCNKEAESYNAFHLKYKDKNARVLGLSTDGQKNKKAAQNFISRHQLKFPNILGEPQDVAIHFSKLTGVDWTGTPTFLIYSPTGELAVQQAGAVPTNIIEEFIQQQSAQ